MASCPQPMSSPAAKSASAALPRWPRPSTLLFAAGASPHYLSIDAIFTIVHDQHAFTNRFSQFHGWRRPKLAAGVATPDRAAVSVEAATPRDSFSTSLFWILNMHHGGSSRGLHSFLRYSFSCCDCILARLSIIQSVWLASAQPDDAAMIRFCCAMVLVLTAPRPRLSPICVSMFCAPMDFFAHGLLRDWNSCCVLVVP
ncbi:hypothetical protein BCR44DRAFT_256781 [Catenaria anguillulae PL171]|uniref:Uncharacterized protein n=1 Tax=Catenaria anguillulae PL171 TaxID=765915 RepID=A0A1Y2HQ34_9FUNG|nr:hypothetical protein BCR44DRAFT_256781 [Catenaria anguillulae PL171]